MSFKGKIKVTNTDLDGIGMEYGLSRITSVTAT